MANTNTKAESVKQANAHLLQTLTQENVMKRLHDWDEQKAKNAMFRSMMNYLHRVETIVYFVAASRNADRHLHLVAGEALSKLFLAMDRIKYKRLWPCYIADVHALKIDHPETWRELEESNISVTKNAIPFVSIGADHPTTPMQDNDFFLAAPELSCLAKEFKDQFHDVRVTAIHLLFRAT